MTRTSLNYLKWGFVMMFVHVNFGRVDVLPDFVGMLLVWYAFHRQEMTETERRTAPLLLVLAADSVLKWITGFENELESLIITVISTYAIYILIGEVAKRIREEQPDTAEVLQWIRIGFAALYALNYLVGAYQLTGVTMVLAIGFLLLLVVFLWVLFHVEPIEEKEP